MFRLLFYIVAGMVAVSSTVWAQSNDMQRIVLDFGMIGVWAAECDKPASDTNNVATYAIASDGNVTLEYELSSGKHNRYLMRQAKRLDDDRIELWEEFLGTDPHPKYDIIIVKNNDRIRTWSATADGKVTVQEGTVLGVRDTKWLQRCR
jgi:hypothetical protein